MRDQQTIRPGYGASLGVGALAGLRSASGLAAVSSALAGSPVAGAASGALALAARFGALLRVAAVGELLLDKLPFMPNRTSPIALAGRVLLGAIAGGLAAQSGGANWLIGGVIGGAAAIAATFAGFHLRRLAVTALRIPDPLVALVEDALVVGGASALTRRIAVEPGAVAVPAA